LGTPYQDHNEACRERLAGWRLARPGNGRPCLPKCGRLRPAFDPVADVARFADRLRRHRDIDVRAEVIPGEQHATVWPAAVTHGLVHLYRTGRQTQGCYRQTRANVA